MTHAPASNIPPTATTAQLAAALGLPDYSIRHAERQHGAEPPEGRAHGRTRLWTRVGQLSLLDSVERLLSDPRYDRSAELSTLRVLRALIVHDARAEERDAVRDLARKQAELEVLEAHEAEVTRRADEIAAPLHAGIDARFPDAPLTTQAERRAYLRAVSR